MAHSFRNLTGQSLDGLQSGDTRSASADRMSPDESRIEATGRTREQTSSTLADFGDGLSLRSEADLQTVLGDEVCPPSGPISEWGSKVNATPSSPVGAPKPDYRDFDGQDVRVPFGEGEDYDTEIRPPIFNEDGTLD